MSYRKFFREDALADSIYSKRARYILRHHTSVPFIEFSVKSFCRFHCHFLIDVGVNLHYDVRSVVTHNSLND